MNNSEVNQLLRAMAWQRIKGELEALLETYRSEDEEKTFDKMQSAMCRFFKDVEDNGLQY